MHACPAGSSRSMGKCTAHGLLQLSVIQDPEAAWELAFPEDASALVDLEPGLIHVKQHHLEVASGPCKHILQVACDVKDGRGSYLFVEALRGVTAVAGTLLL